jgi:hypothetical protein
MDLSSLSKEQLIALLAAQAKSQARHPIEFAAWANDKKVEDWHADYNVTITVGVMETIEALTAALAAGQTEVKFFANGYNGSGTENAPVFRGYSDLKAKTKQPVAAAANG